MSVNRADAARLATAAAAGFSAMQYVADPANWPAFAAWAEQRTPGEIWNESDRHCMASDSLLLNRLAEILDSAGGVTS